MASSVDVRVIGEATYRVTFGRGESIRNVEVKTPGGNWRRVQTIPTRKEAHDLSQSHAGKRAR